MGILRRAVLATVLLLGIHLALAGPVEQIGGGEGSGMIRPIASRDDTLRYVFTTYDGARSVGKILRIEKEPSPVRRLAQIA